MADNLFAEVPAAVIAKTNISFVAAGITAANTRIIFKVNDPLQSYMPTRTINSLFAFVAGEDYYIWPTANMDLTAILAPPLSEAVDETTFLTMLIEDLAGVGTRVVLADETGQLSAPLIQFSNLVGSTWDGTMKNKTLTGPTALTFSSAERTGVLRVQQDGVGGRTLSVNGIPLDINTDPDSLSYITAVFNDVTGQYDFVVELNVYSIAGGAADVTDPALVSITVEDAVPTDVVYLFDEPLNPAIVPDPADVEILVNAAPATVDSVIVTGSTMVATLAVAIEEGDTVLASYTPGTNKLQDGSGNEAAALVNEPVTNNVVDTPSVIESIAWHSWTDPALNRSVRVAGADTFITSLLDQVAANGVEFDMVQATEANQPKYIAAGINGLPSLEIETSTFLETQTLPVTLLEPITRIVVVEFKAFTPNPGYIVSSGSGDGASLAYYTANKPFMFAGTVLMATAFSFALDTPYVILAEFVGDGTSDKLYINGTLITMDGTTAGAAPSMGSMRIGHPSAATKAWVAPHFTYNGILSSGDRNGVIDELKAKYGIV